MSSSSTDRQADAPMTPAALSRGLREGVDAIHRALVRLFAPHPVTTTDMDGTALARASAEQLADPDDGSVRHLGAAFLVEGPVHARLFLLVESGHDERLTSALLRRASDATRLLDAEDRAAFSELANIVASSFLNGLARELRLRLVPSVPLVAERPLHDVLNTVRPSDDWTVSAQFSVALPSGEAKGLFLAMSEPQAPRT